MLTKTWITLTDKEGDRVDVVACRVVRLDTLENKTASSIVFLDTPENNVMWAKETVEEVRDLLRQAE